MRHRQAICRTALTPQLKPWPVCCVCRVAFAQQLDDDEAAAIFRIENRAEEGRRIRPITDGDPPLAREMRNEGVVTATDSFSLRLVRFPFDP
jgi:hypothetical protein